MHTAPRGRVSTVGSTWLRLRATRAQRHSMKGHNKNVLVPLEHTPSYPAAKQETCLHLPSVNFSSARVLPWLRDGFNRCAVKGKQAGITAHPPPLTMASLLPGENGTHRNHSPDQACMTNSARLAGGLRDPYYTEELRSRLPGGCRV